MPAIKKIKSLENILSEWVFKFLLHKINYLKSNKEKAQLKEFILHSLNMNLRQKLISQFLGIHIYQLEFSKKCQLLEITADASLSEIDVSKSGSIFVEEVFHLYRVIAMEDFRNITKFGINCNIKAMVEQKYIPEVNNLIYKPFSQMKNLRCVILRELGDSLLLHTLGNSCPHLEYLDVKDSWLVNDSGIISLLIQNPEEISNLSQEEISQYSGTLNSCANHISYLGISGTDAATISIMLSLMLLPNLCSFGGPINAASVTNVLLYMKSKKKMETLKLIELWDDDLSLQEINALDYLCPRLETLNTNEFSLIALETVKQMKIRSLIINCDYKNCSNELLNFLSVNGSLLVSLHLDHSVNIQVNLFFLIELTPLLRDLKIPLSVDKQEIENNSNTIEKWHNLITADVCVNSALCFKMFIICSPELTNLKLKYKPEMYSGESFSDINDDLIKDILQNECLLHLQVFSLEECAFSVEGLEAILKNCPNLKQIGKLFYWQKLIKDDLNLLKKKITNSNWDLKVVLKEEYGDMAW